MEDNFARNLRPEVLRYHGGNTNRKFVLAASSFDSSYSQLREYRCNEIVSGDVILYIGSFEDASATFFLNASLLEMFKQIAGSWDLS
jgi:hypothetical protein